MKQQQEEGVIIENDLSPEELSKLTEARINAKKLLQSDVNNAPEEISRLQKIIGFVQDKIRGVSSIS